MRGRRCKMHQTPVLNIFLLFCAIFSHSARASPVIPRNSTQQWTFAEIPPSTELRNWYPCFDDFLCAVLDVPLDYQKPQGARSLIPLINFPAKTKPYKGMILANPGGPGDSGVDLVRSLASQQIPFLGLDYDFVSWDPRGSGYAIPAADCGLLGNLTIPLGPAMKRRALDKLYGPSLPETYFDNVYQITQELGRECTSSIGGPTDAGPHMSTTTIARDMISILDAHALECEDGDASLLNFWGMSYGTFLGQTFASLFPERIGRVVLDGVLDPDETAKESGLNMVTQSDEAFSTFFLYCHLAGPTACPFYTGTTPHDIYLRFEAIVNQLNVTQALEQNWDNSTAIWIVLQGLKGVIFPATYHAVDEFPLIGELLPAVETLFPNITLEAVLYLETLLGTDINPPINNNDTWSTGTACADNGGRYIGWVVSDWADSIKVLEGESWLGGESQVVNQIFCSGWNITTAERYGGPFGGKTKNPILFVSNTLDPITPIVNGRKGIRIFEDAQLLTVEGVGHTSLTTKNACSLEKIGAFLINGTLPGNNNYCALEAGPWNITIPGPLSKRSEILEISDLFRSLR